MQGTFIKVCDQSPRAPVGPQDRRSFPRTIPGHPREEAKLQSSQKLSTQGYRKGFHRENRKERRLPFVMEENKVCLSFNGNFDL